MCVLCKDLGFDLFRYIKPYSARRVKFATDSPLDTPPSGRMVRSVARRERQDQQPVRLVVQLTPELTARVRQHHRESGLPGTPQDTVRELVTAALDYPDVESSLVRNARLLGYLSVRRDFHELAAAAVDQLAREWERRQREVGREGVGDGEHDAGATG